MGVTNVAGTANPSGAHEFNPGFSRGSCCSIIFDVVFGILVSLFGHCIFWPSAYGLWFDYLLQPFFITFKSITWCMCTDIWRKWLTKKAIHEIYLTSGGDANPDIPSGAPCLTFGLCRSSSFLCIFVVFALFYLFYFVFVVLLVVYRGRPFVFVFLLVL